MYAQLFAQSPLLVLPLVALALFGAVFFAVVVRVFARRATSYDAAALLPLERSGEPTTQHEERHV